MNRQTSQLIASPLNIGGQCKRLGGRAWLYLFKKKKKEEEKFKRRKQ